MTTEIRGTEHPRRRAAGGPRRAHARGRILIAMVAFVALYGLIGGRLVALGMQPKLVSQIYRTAQDSVAAARPDVIDRNGEILATDLSSASLYAEPRKIVDVDEALEAIASVFPELDNAATRRRLASDAGFVWLKREISSDERARMHALGIPGIDFLTENRRFYPGGATAGHLLGHVNVDNQGIAGIEKAIDERGLAVLQEIGLARTGNPLEPVELSLDLRVQHAVRDELARAMERYQAKAAIGIVLDARTAEVLAMSSQPDYDPNDPREALKPDHLNRATAGVFELGSVFKVFSTALALDSGMVTLSDHFDARTPLRISGFTIGDFHAKNRVLSVPEIFIYSSNVGTARMVQRVGVERQKAFLKRIGMFDRLDSELPEMASPIVPQRWSELTSATVSFGHGLSVSPMHAAVAAAALVNGGYLLPPTFFPRTREQAAALAQRVVSPQTSEGIRGLMRLNAVKGSGRRAQVPGYQVGGKTGTADKIENGRYAHDKRLNSFLAAFPMNDPHYVVLVVLDEPKPEEGAHSATAGLNAAPTVANIISRIGPMLRIEPVFDDAREPILASFGG